MSQQTWAETLVEQWETHVRVLLGLGLLGSGLCSTTTGSRSRRSSSGSSASGSSRDWTKHSMTSELSACSEERNKVRWMNNKNRQVRSFGNHGLTIRHAVKQFPNVHSPKSLGIHSGPEGINLRKITLWETCMIIIPLTRSRPLRARNRHDGVHNAITGCDFVLRQKPQHRQKTLVRKTSRALSSRQPNDGWRVDLCVIYRTRHTQHKRTSWKHIGWETIHRAKWLSNLLPGTRHEEHGVPTGNKNFHAI